MLEEKGASRGRELKTMERQQCLQADGSSNGYVNHHQNFMPHSNGSQDRESPSPFSFEKESSCFRQGEPFCLFAEAIDPSISPQAWSWILKRKEEQIHTWGSQKKQNTKPMIFLFMN
jgi:hypothetical protein